MNSLGTADPAVMPGHPGLRGAEGIHLVLRREGETDRWARRRRRADEGAGTRPGVPGAPAPDQAGTPDQAGPQGQVGTQDQVSAPERVVAGRHTAPRRPAEVATAEHLRVFPLRGGDPGALADQLDVIAASAAVLSDTGLDGLARQLAIAALAAAMIRHRCGSP